MGRKTQEIFKLSGSFFLEGIREESQTWGNSLSTTSTFHEQEGEGCIEDTYLNVKMSTENVCLATPSMVKLQFSPMFLKMTSKVQGTRVEDHVKLKEGA